MIKLLNQIEYWRKRGNFNFELFIAVCKAKQYAVNIETKQKTFRNMKKYKVWIWFTLGNKKELSYKIVWAYSPEDAKRKADVWEKIIHKVELIK